MNDINRNWMKKAKIGADGFLQLALQLAGRKYYGHPGNTACENRIVYKFQCLHTSQHRRQCSKWAGQNASDLAQKKLKLAATSI